MKAAILTVSDSRTLATDKSGDVLEDLLRSSDFTSLERTIVTDDAAAITSMLVDLSDREDIHLILTTGGTGLGPRDVTPEATATVFERIVPGISEAMRMSTLVKTPTAMLSRGVAGVRNKTLIINLPGSPKGVAECFDVILPVLGHALRLIAGDTDHS